MTVRWRASTLIAVLCLFALAPAARAAIVVEGAIGPALGGTAGQLAGPTRAATGPDGSLYVADAGAKRIVKFSPAMAFERMWGKDVIVGGGAGAEICTTADPCQAPSQGSAGGEFSGINGISVSPAGIVAVTDGRRLQMFDASGTFLRAFGKDTVTGGSTDFEVCTVAANCKAGVLGALGGEFNNGRGLGFAPNGDVVVADSSHHRAQRFTGAGAFVHAFGWDVVTGGSTGFEVCAAASQCKAGTDGTAEGQLGSAEDVTAGSSGVYVATSPAWVQRFDHAGAYVGRFTHTATAQHEGFDLTAAGELVFATSGPPRIHRFAAAPGHAFMDTGVLSNILLDTPYDVAAFGDQLFAPQGYRNHVRRLRLSGDAPPATPPVTPPAVPPAVPPAAVPVPAASPAPAPVVSLPPLPKASSVIVLPSAKTCVSRRKFRIRLRQPRGLRIASAVVKVNGKRVKTVRGKRVTAPVNLTGLPKGRFTVRIEIRTADGRKVVGSRTYRTCAPKRSSKSPPRV
ncbi:MAG: hypothetical protein JHC95_06635 [Solirubrobacteraceae bacterium]|nr:hypothetical protein [Solirubrobacteraceae bacterium]